MGFKPNKKMPPINLNPTVKHTWERLTAKSGGKGRQDFLYSIWLSGFADQLYRILTGRQDDGL